VNGPHVTFIAGEKDDRIVDPSELQDWMDVSIQIDYEHEVWTDGRSYWINCVAPQLDKIRASLGLRPRSGYHITLGNTK